MKQKIILQTISKSSKKENEEKDCIRNRRDSNKKNGSIPRSYIEKQLNNLNNYCITSYYVK
jgi:hypothetical protein